MDDGRLPRIASPKTDHETDWEQVFDAVSDPMAILTSDYRVVRANAAYVAWLHTTRGRCEGQVCFVHAQASGARATPCENCPLPQTVATGRPSFVRQVRMERTEPGGAPAMRVYETWTYPIHAVDGQVERVVEIIKDVTERERLAQVTREAEALREADQLKAELLGTVSHELRSPLASIKGYAATLLKHERRLSATERLEFLQAIVEASDRLEAVIDRMLEMSRLESGKQRLERAPVDLERLTREAVRTVQQQAAERTPGRFSLSLDVQVLPRGRASVVLGDSRRLRDVLDQVLGNAIKYSPDGGNIAVTLRPGEPRAHATDATEAWGQSTVGEWERAGPGSLALMETMETVEIEVRDGGIGIPAEHLSRVFERFHRIDTRLTREADGLGLGLAIAKRVIELHGGRIWAESGPGGGSAFRIVLPLAHQATGEREAEGALETGDTVDTVDAALSGVEDSSFMTRGVGESR